MKVLYHRVTRFFDVWIKQKQTKNTKEVDRRMNIDVCKQEAGEHSLSGVPCERKESPRSSTQMKWLAIFGLVGLMMMPACLTTDVGNPCDLNEAGQKQIEELQGKKVRVAIPSFNCTLTFCFATYYNEADPTKGYCSKICETAEECPKGYTCEVVVSLQKEALPEEFRESLAELIGKKICMKPEPTAQQ
ncbi:MAG TPA: hypothetical protein DCE42_14775 [Myxococcales bacterium]|nr:hypothetical protein [Deltaproteobacteria bacterium]MBU54531.1 hypothetical protein [Deltaproteobacteria bacterium]HAA56026.1 hypothetical protein [Myxococcales bacterium]|tara:strand:+ start:5109 stop:5675 length:567 start_codon:yes stop_codon:yes gene_type:complete